jgi:hypothetical protein
MDATNHSSHMVNNASALVNTEQGKARNRGTVPDEPYTATTDYKSATLLRTSTHPIGHGQKSAF